MRPHPSRPQDSADTVVCSSRHSLGGSESGVMEECQKCGSASDARDLMHDFIACFVEFIGTFMFLLMSFQGASTALMYRQHSLGDPSMSITDIQTILYISLSFGMSLIVTVWIFFRVTGAAFNPAVVFSLWLIGSITSRRSCMVVLAQLVGGIAASAVSKALTNGPFAVANTLAEGYSKGQGFGLEMFTTCLLCFTVLLMAAEKSKTTFLAPVAIGLAVFVGHLSSVGFTGSGMNPARTLGPCVIDRSFPDYAYVYYLGQFAGALVATIIYVILKEARYSEVVRNIDCDDFNASAVHHKGPLMKLFGVGEPLHPAAHQGALTSRLTLALGGKELEGGKEEV